MKRKPRDSLNEDLGVFLVTWSGRRLLLLRTSIFALAMLSRFRLMLGWHLGGNGCDEVSTDIPVSVQPP